MIAHYHREISGEGQHVDLSIHQSIALTILEIPTEWEFFQEVETRHGQLRKMAIPPRVFQPYIWECKDGHISLTTMWGGMLGATTSKRLTELMDEEGTAPDFLKEIDWLKLDMREITQEKYDQMMVPIGEFFKRHTRAELHEMAIRKDLMLYPVNNIKDLVESAQLKARDFLVKVEHPRLGASITYPWHFVGFSETLCSLRRAPCIGEHAEEVFKELIAGEESSSEIKKPSLLSTSRRGNPLKELRWSS